MTRRCGVVLAAGEGTRLRPLTEIRPKALCTVAGRALLDHALERLRPLVSDIAVNVHHHRDALLAHLDGADVHVSVEDGPEALGTAGALGALHDWIDGREVVVVNADAFGADAAPLLARPANRTRLLVAFAPHRPDFDGLWAYVGAAVLPWEEVATFEPVPSGLYEASWRERAPRGLLDLIPSSAQVIDCGTPADYLGANLVATGGAGFIEPGAVVAGDVDRSVVWAGARVEAGERLRYAIRLPGGRTLQPLDAG